MVEDTERNSSRCRCPGCPTHDDCMSRNDERLYCSRDRTECDVTAHGCLCNECPVWSETSGDLSPDEVALTMPLARVRSESGFRAVFRGCLSHA